MKVIVLQEGSRPNEIGYHFTTIDKLVKIFQSDCILATNEEDDPPTWSYTRQKNGMYYRNMKKPENVRITLDIDKISEHYKVFPFSWAHVKKNSDNFEYEERVEGKPVSTSGNFKYGLKNAHEYILEISFNPFLEKALSDKPYLILDNQYYSALKEKEIILNSLELQHTHIKKAEYELDKNAFNMLEDYGDAEKLSKWLYHNLMDSIKENPTFVHEAYNNFESNIRHHFKDISKLFRLKAKFCDLYLNKIDFLNKTEKSLDYIVDSNPIFLEPDKEFIEKNKKRATECIVPLQELKTADGTPITSLTLFRRYLKEYGIKFSFINNDILIRNSKYIFTDEKDKIEEKILKYITTAKLNFTRKLKQATKLYEKYRKELNDKIYHYLDYEPTLLKEFKSVWKNVFVKAQDYLITKWFSDMKISDSSQIYLTSLSSAGCALTAFADNRVQTKVSDNPKELIKTLENRYTKSLYNSCKFKKKPNYISGKQLKEAILEYFKKFAQLSKKNASATLHFEVFNSAGKQSSYTLRIRYSYEFDFYYACSTFDEFDDDRRIFE